MGTKYCEENVQEPPLLNFQRHQVLDKTNQLIVLQLEQN